MRFRVGALLCLFLAFLGAGCRKTLAPVTDNQAPETWIVAAPQDTITSIDPATGAPVRPNIAEIPVRFHLYWAGSDRDGAVNGFFFAVVETLAVPPGGSGPVPSLPGPKARDYRFTTKTDSIFVFTTSEEVNTRQHAFYIYSVDDKGRADPTPARFIFRAYDSYPPKAIIEELRAVGTEYELLPGGGVRAVDRTYLVTDFYEVSNDHPFPRDTVSADARISVRWRGEPTIPSTVVTGYRYKLDEPNFNVVDSSVHTAEYNTGVGLDKVNPGPKIFTLRAVGQSGWRGEATRWFQMNFAPDTWFAGPDPNDPLAGWRTYTDGNGKRYWFLDFAATGWAAFQGIPGTQLSPDSVQLVPALRPERKTFFEMYNDRLWLHQEGDTVHLNSWVMFPTGGFDRDSPYSVKVNEALLPPALSGAPVLTRGPSNGSPIGFRLRIPVKASSGQQNVPSESTTYPVFDPTSTFDRPVISGYQGMTTAGRAYAEIRAEDGNGTVDRRIDQRPGGAVGIVQRVEEGGATAEDIALRSKILTFYVNRIPRLRRDATFRPRTTDILTRNPTFVIPADDVDQLDPKAALNRVGGTPTSYGPILERKIAILGKHPATNRDTCYIVPQEFTFANGITFSIPAEIIAPGNITVRIRLCDCSDCDVLDWTGACRGLARDIFKETTATTGTCVDTDIPCRLAAPVAEGTEGGPQAAQRPGSPTESGRRQ
jgi:hypothetical protein